MLHFDITWSDLYRVAGEIGGTDKQVAFALQRALRRTEATLRKLSSKGLTQVLQLRAAKALRRRLKTIKLRKAGGLSASNSIGLWYGLNGLPVSSFKGTPRQNASGAAFRGTQFDGAFVARSKVKGKKTIFKRTTKARLHIEEQQLEVEDKAVVYIEDEIFSQVEDIFWNHFRRDLAARVKFDVGNKNDRRS